MKNRKLKKKRFTIAAIVILRVPDVSIPSTAASVPDPSPAVAAVNNGDVECQILEAAKAGDLDQVQRFLESFPNIVNCRDLDGRHSTPLHFASGYNRVSVVQFLLDQGADVHAKDKG